MIDTIIINLYSNTLGKIPLNGNCVIENTDKSNNPKVRVVKWSIRNMAITYTKVEPHLFKIKLVGSLHKYLKEDNLCYFNYKDLKKALQLLSEETGLALDTGVIKRIDFGANIPVSKPVRLFNFMLKTSSSSYKKDTYNNCDTVTFRKDHIALSFYNKVRELDKATKIRYRRSLLKNKYVIRYELKLFKRLRKSLGLSDTDLLVSDLIESKDIYKRILKLWHNEYNSIVKVSEKLIFRSSTHFREFLELSGIRALGGLDKVIEMLGIWSQKQNHTSQTKYRIKTKLIKISKHNLKTDHLILELDKKIKNFEKGKYKFCPLSDF